VLETREHEPAPQLRLARQPFKRRDCCVGSAWRYEQGLRSVAHRRTHPAHVCGHDRDPRRLRFHQHLRQPLGQRHVQEGVAAAVELPELRPVRHLSDQLDRRGEPACCHGRRNRGLQRAVSGDRESPARIAPPQLGDRLYK
jgi:hypothetical protein